MKTPRIPTFTLAGIADKIQTLQETLDSNLSWLDYSFGVADRYEKLVGDETHVLPLCYVDNTTDPIDMRPWPNDSWDSYAFWHVDDPGNVEYSDEIGAATRKYAIWNYNVACIVVADPQKIDDSPYNETKSNFKNDILKVFQNNTDINFAFWITGVYERNVEEIFAPYTIVEQQKVLKYPRVAFRFEGTIQFKQACPINNTYSVTTRT
jgi:hypothetical protein